MDTGVGTARVEHEGGPTGRRLIIDEEIHGQVDLADPTLLRLDYQARLTSIALALDPPQGGRILHLGGGAFAIPRAIQAVRDDLTQTVVERSAAIIKLAEAQLGLRRTTRMVVRKADARTAVEKLPDASVDLVVSDAFVGQRVPVHLSTLEFAAELRRILRPGGHLVANVVDEAPWSTLGSTAAAFDSCFSDTAALGSRGVARLRDPGNVFVVGSVAAVPRAALRQAGAVGAHPYALVADGRLRQLAAHNRALHD